MTVGELIEALQTFDPSRVVCVDTHGWLGLYPVADKVSPYRAFAFDCDTVVLEPSKWP